MSSQHVYKSVKLQCDFRVKAKKRWVHDGAPQLTEDGPCGEMFDVRANLIRHLGLYHDVEKQDAGRFICPSIPGYTVEMRNRFEKMEKVVKREAAVRNRNRNVGEEGQSESESE